MPMSLTASIRHAGRHRIEWLLADIDDTISTHGRITRIAFDALWKAHDAGLRIIPVTGRPAGWCDHIARMWPVSAVIGENGGLIFRMTPNGLQRQFVQDAETRRLHRARLQALCKEILEAFPGAAVASDQPYREYDLAIDFAEDVAPPLEPADAERIAALFRSHGATARISSIHVNGWFGDFNKLTTTREFLETSTGRSFEDLQPHCAFIGDSPNDEPMFAAFRWSFGVANVRRFEPFMQARPRFVTAAEGGAGFAELVDALLATRAASDETCEDDES